MSSWQDSQSVWGRRWAWGIHALFGGAIAVAYHLRVVESRFLLDDAYISFRYARNLVDGLGLVWNPGERVEGYTNFLWVIVLAAGMVFGAPPEGIAWLVGEACGFAVLIALAVFMARRGPRSFDLGIWFAPAVLVAFQPFCTWASGGLETMFFTALVTAGLLRRQAESESGRLPLLSSLCLTLATLARPDGALFLAVAAGSVVADEVRRRGTRWRPAAIGAFLLPTTLLAAHLLFRLSYYGWLLPNPVYAKAGWAWQQGLWYVTFFARDTGAWLALPPLVVGVWRREPVYVLFGAALGVYGVSLVAVGGDTFEFRALVPLLPLMAWAIADAARTWVKAPLGAAVAVAGAVAWLAWVNTTSALDDGRRTNGVTAPWIAKRYTAKRRLQGQALADLIAQGVLPPDLIVATSGVGAFTYESGVQVVDLLGLNDETIAHEGVIRARGRIGHRRRPTLDYLAERSVTMVDVAGGFVFQQSEPERYLRTRALMRTQQYNNLPGSARLSLRCRRVPGGHLLFATPLSDEAFEEIFGALSPCGT